MTRTHILSASAVPQALLDELRTWFECQWGHNVDPFEGTHGQVRVPTPVVAVDAATGLIGGLSFTSAAKPDPNPAGEIGVWINMLLVSRTQRKRGIGVQLVRAAEIESQRLAIPELFVLSEFPNLYRKLGWQALGLDRAGRQTLLTKRLI